VFNSLAQRYALKRLMFLFCFIVPVLFHVFCDAGCNEFFDLSIQVFTCLARVCACAHVCDARMCDAYVCAHMGLGLMYLTYFRGYLSKSLVLLGVFQLLQV